MVSANEPLVATAASYPASARAWASATRLSWLASTTSTLASAIAYSTRLPRVDRSRRPSSARSPEATDSTIRTKLCSSTGFVT